MKSILLPILMATSLPVLAQPDVLPVKQIRRVASQLAEGIDFFTPSEHDIRVDFQPVVAALGVTDLIATAPSAEITTFDYGHFNRWPVTVDPLQVNGGSVDWGRPGVRWAWTIRRSGASAISRPSCSPPRSTIPGPTWCR